RSLHGIVTAAGGRLELVDEAQGRKGRGSSRWIDLVDVPIAEKFTARRAHIAHFHCNTLAQLLLHIEVVNLDIGGAQLLVHRKNVGCAKSRRIKDPYPGLNRGRRTEAESNCIWANPVVCGAGVE